MKFVNDIVFGETFIFFDGREVYIFLNASYMGANYSVANKRKCTSIFSRDFIYFLEETKSLILDKILFDVSCNPIVTEEKGASYVNVC